MSTDIASFFAETYLRKSKKKHTSAAHHILFYMFMLDCVNLPTAP